MHVRVPSHPYMWILVGTQHAVGLKTVSKRTPSIIDNFDTVLYMYVAILLVFDRISDLTGEGRMRLNVVSTKLISTKRRPLDVIENSLMLLAVLLPQAIKCLKKC